MCDLCTEKQKHRHTRLNTTTYLERQNRPHHQLTLLPPPVFSSFFFFALLHCRWVREEYPLDLQYILHSSYYFLCSSPRSPTYVIFRIGRETTLVGIREEGSSGETDAIAVPRRFSGGFPSLCLICRPAAATCTPSFPRGRKLHGQWPIPDSSKFPIKSRDLR